MSNRSRLAAIGLAVGMLAACARMPGAAPGLPIHYAIQADYLGLASTQANQSQWYLDRIGAGPDPIPARGYCDAVVVAIVDTGVDPQQPELSRRLLPLIDEVGSDTYQAGSKLVAFEGRDGNGHGTHVAGLVAAVMGANNPISLLPIKAIDRTGVGDDAAIARGIHRAVDWRDPVRGDRRVRVINLSIGGKTSSRVLEDALSYAVERDVLVVVAAGNRDRDVDFPAAFPAALAVSASTAQDGLASYSNRGDSVGIAAPGGDSDQAIDSTWPSYLTAGDLGKGVTTPHLRAAMMGTSMAAPLVTGAAALLFASDPYLSAAQVRARLEAWSVDLGPVGPDGYFGAGRLDVTSSLLKGAHDAS